MNNRTVREVMVGEKEVIVQIAVGPRDAEIGGIPLGLEHCAICVNVGVSPERAEELAALLLDAAAEVRAKRTN